MLLAGVVAGTVGICSNKFKSADVLPFVNKPPYKAPAASAKDPFAEPLPFKGIEAV